MTADAESFAQIAHQMQSEGDEPVTAARIVELATTMIPDVEEASLTVRVRRGRYRSLGASAASVQAADAAQHQLEEGPCVDSVDEEDWFRSGDLRNDGRWPTWGPRAADLGFESLLSLPLVGGREPAASINLYAAPPGRFADPDVVGHAIIFATHAAMALQAAHQITGLQTAIASRHLIGMAQGVLVERYSLTAQQAFALLQRVSSSTNRKLREVAQELLATGVLPE